jgi:ABC-type transport system involved in cytochrome c biogenesis permease subunit
MNFIDVWRASHSSVWTAWQFPALALSSFSLTLSFMAGLLYFLEERSQRTGKLADFFKKLPGQEALARAVSVLIHFGFSTLTVAIILGARWSYDASGRYWGGSPGEIWTVLTWLVYALYIHLSWFSGWRGKRSVIFSTACFIAVFIVSIALRSK